MTIQMVERDVRQSALQIETAADSAAKVAFKDDLAAVATALPGSRSGPAATSFATEVDSDVKSWVTAAHSHHRSVTEAAGHIKETDIAVGNRYARGGRQVY